MASLIKVKLCELDKTQVDLLKELRKRGYKKLSPSELSRLIRGVSVSPRTEAIKKLIDEILDEWETEQDKSV